MAERLTDDNSPYGFDLVATYRNGTGESVYLQTCDGSDTPMYGIRPVDTTYQKAVYSPNYGCAQHDRHIKVRPGQRRTDTLRVMGPNEYMHETFHFLLEGTFRLAYDARSCRTGIGCKLPDSLATSNAFEIRLAK